MRTLLAIVLGAMCLTSYGASREIDYAVEDAAVKTIQELAERNFNIDNIAFIGLSNDRNDLTHVFRSGLLRVPGTYSFFTRDDSELNLLVKEIEFGELRGDIMNSTTIKKFGKIKGVDALLYGKVQEATSEDKNGIFRTVLTLADIETGELLWTGNITGKYTSHVEHQNIDQKIIEAAIDAGRKIAQKISDSHNMTASDIFILPLVGKMGDELSDIVTTEIASVGSNGISFYTEPSPVNTNTVRDLSYKLAGEGSQRVSQAQLNTILKKLDQLYNAPSLSSNNTSQHVRRAYMVGTVINATPPVNGNEAKVTVTFKLRSCSNNQLITGATVSGNSTEEVLTTNETLQKVWHDSGILLQLIAAGVVVLVLASGFLSFTRMMTGVR